MRRTTVLLPDDLDDRLRLEAKRRGVSIGEVVREALAASLDRPRSLPAWVGMFSVGPRPEDEGKTHREIARELMDADYERQKREFAEVLAERERRAAAG